MWVPYELMTLGTALSEAGYEVQLLDERVTEDAAMMAAKRAGEALFVGVSSRPGDQVVRALELFELMKNRFPMTPTVWGGWFPSSFPHECIQLDNVDYLVRGAADESIVQLAESLRKNWGNVEGIAGVNSARHGYPPCENPRRPLSDINKTPEVDWTLFPMEYYVTDDGCISHYTSRGCPGSCRFCGVPRLYPAIWSGYSAERVIRDIVYFVRELGVRIVKFQDVDVFADVERISDICRGLLEEHLKIRWIADLRVANAIKFSDEAWRLIRESGCSELELGAETGSDEQLAMIFKECTRQEIVAVVEEIVAHKIFARVNFVLGFPGETKEQLRDTLSLIEELAQLGEYVRFHFYRFAPSPSTRLGKGVWAKSSMRHNGDVPRTVETLNDIAQSYQNPRMFWLKRDVERSIRNLFEIDLPLAYYKAERPLDGWKKRLMRVLMWVAKKRLRFGFTGLRFERRVLRLAKVALPMSREFEWAENETSAKLAARAADAMIPIRRDDAFQSATNS